MTDQFSIRDALINAVTDMNLGYPIAWPNRIINPKPDEYLEVIRLPNGSRGAGWDDAGKLEIGILRLGFHTKLDAGEAGALAIVDQIMAAWPMGHTIYFEGGKVSVTDPPRSEPPIFDGQEAIYPVTIRYQS